MSTLEERIKELEVQLSSQESAMAQKKKSADKYLKQLQEQYSDLKGLIAAALAEKNTLKKNIINIEKQFKEDKQRKKKELSDYYAKEKEKVDQKVLELQKEIVEVKKQVSAKRKVVKDFDNRITIQQGQYESLKDENNGLSEQVGNSTTFLKKTKNQISELATEVENLENYKEQLDFEIDSKKQESAKIKIGTTAYKNAKKKAEDAEAKAAVVIAESKEILSKRVDFEEYRASQKKKLEQKVKHYEELLSKYNGLVEELKQNKEDIELRKRIVQRQQDSIAVERRRHKDERSELMAEIKELKKEIKILQS